jgi:hypothetical protein
MAAKTGTAHDRVSSLAKAVWQGKGVTACLAAWVLLLLSHDLVTQGPSLPATNALSPNPAVGALAACNVLYTA